ncbi:ArnT family glycosyltransferase [Lutispora thermophila]|uniref:Dolichyl-phosphate-mannose-protein mannosyltransferase n=1 Tax=Lutispora thermophila DSM 19022 TaxID=1122184 RepID=A0A1M6BPJ5_9FIRM|nr:glycosyltransferase family 39 protein [Lutispora thermophila]SHI50637.1 Dolichyl-phosphate-mannose-protein mannosyltransferase [Lutispora thermophila DSM 19022]
MSNRKCTIAMTMLVFLFIFALRIPHINNSPCEQGDYWRQSDTESIARNFIEDRFNIFYPQFNYDGEKPNYVQLEFQITTFLIALLYKTFGYHYYLARLVPITFFMGSSIYLYLIAKRYYGNPEAWYAVIAYAIMPMNIFYTRAIMPESAALFFFIGAFYYFTKWYENEKLSALFTSAIFTCLSISQKTPTIFIGLAMIFLVVKKYGLRFVFKWELWVFAIISLLPNTIYIQWSREIAEFDYVTNIGLLHIVPKSLKAFADIESYKLAGGEIVAAVSTGLIIPIMAGLISSKWTKDYPVLCWTFAMLLEVIAVAAVIKLRYYFIFITPIAAIWAGKTLGKLGEGRRVVFSVLMGLSILALWNYKSCKSFFVEKDTILKQAEVIRRYTEKDDLIVIGTLEPTLLNQSGRNGWRANIKYHKDIPSGAESEINYLIEKGAKYFSPLEGCIYGDDGSYRKYLDENFEKLGDGDYFIYKLQDGK